ncbi:MAG: hypothetical protein ACK4RK_18240 [Gemmataceae bacterium]
MRRSYFFLAILALCLPLADSGAQEDKVDELMKKKLTHSQQILEGIALNNFDKIAANADDLVLISKATEWRVVKSPQYELHSNDFRRSAITLAQMARDKNLDGATLAYLDMTMSCVRCHKYVREVRMAGLDGERPLLAVKAPAE